MKNTALLDTSGIVFMGVYLVFHLLIGVAGMFAHKENSPAGFCLGGRGMRPFLLFLTLYATQYSGNTLIGMAGTAYRQVGGGLR
jgi:solute:Na+ symporter, SSS family